MIVAKILIMGHILSTLFTIMVHMLKYYDVKGKYRWHEERSFLKILRGVMIHVFNKLGCSVQGRQRDSSTVQFYFF